MDKTLYNGTVAYLRTKRLEGVSKEAWGASSFRMKRNGMRYNDRETKKRFKKFALLHELKGSCLLLCCNSTPIKYSSASFNKAFVVVVLFCVKVISLSLPSFVPGTQLMRNGLIFTACKRHGHCLGQVACFQRRWVPPWSVCHDAAH